MWFGRRNRNANRQPAGGGGGGDDGDGALDPLGAELWGGRVERPFQGLTRFPNTPAMSSVFLPRAPANADEGGKVTLHSSVLEELSSRFRQQLPYPVLFEIRNTRTGRTSHCGVLEFSAPDRKAYLPRWMMQNLELEDGDPVDFSLVQLPKVHTLTFQPLNWAFTKIDNPKAELENCLVAFPAMTQGDTFMVKINGREHYLRATKVGVSGQGTAGCLIDTQVTVEFEKPLEDAPVEEQVHEIAEGQVIEDQLNTDEYRYFRFRFARDRQRDVVFTVTCSSGDPDLYVSMITDKPVLENHQWTADGIGNKQLRISARDRLGNSGGFVYVSVHAYKAPAAFKLQVEEDLDTGVDAMASDDEGKEDSGSLLGGAWGGAADDRKRAGGLSSTSPPAQPGASANSSSSAAPSASSAGAAGSFGMSADPNAELCENCYRPIPPRQYQMHVMRCARTNWRCDICHQLVPRAEKDRHAHCSLCPAVMEPHLLAKHTDRLHRKRICADCGEWLDPDLIELHRQDRCPMRGRPCKFCEASIKALELRDHEQYCGSKSVPCPTCGESVPRRKMDTHNAVAHGINPSLPGADQPLDGVGGGGGGSASGGGPRPSLGNPSAQSELDMLAAMEQSRLAAQRREDDMLAAAIAASMSGESKKPGQLQC